MADFDLSDIKVPISADYGGAEKDGAEWARGFQRGAAQVFSAGIGGMLLGNGMPTNQGPAGGQDSVLSVLNKIHQTLQYGFMAMTQGLGFGGPPKSTGGGGGGGGQNEPPPPQRRQAGTSFGGVVSLFDNLAGRVPWRQIADTYVNPTEANKRELVAQAVGQIPVVGQILGPMMQIYASQARAQEHFLDTSLGVYKTGGQFARMGFRRLTETRAGQDLMEDYGVTGREAADYFNAASRYGGGRRSQDSAYAAIQLQGAYGLGQEGLALGRAATQSGSMSQGAEKQLFVETLATGFAMGLDRGRFPEAFAMLTRTLETMGVRGETDRYQQMSMMAWISQMGDRFRGDTPAARAMGGAIDTLMTGGAGSYNQVQALMAAGLGTPGVDYFEATWRMEHAGGEGGTTADQFMMQFGKNPLVTAYLNAPDDSTLHSTSVKISKFFYNGRVSSDQIAAILQNVKKNGMPSKAGDRIDTRSFSDRLDHPRLPAEEGNRQRQRVRADYSQWQGFDADRTVDESDSGDSNLGIDYQDGGQSGVAPASQQFQGSSQTVGPFTTRDQMESAYNPGFSKHGLNQTRTQDQYGNPTKPFPHGARDVFLPPGTPVYTPATGMLKGVFEMKGMGFGVSFVIDEPKSWRDGEVLRFLHLESVELKPGRYGPGMRIGVTKKGSLGGGKSHLHLEAHHKGWSFGKDSTYDDPYDILGTSGVNQLYGNAASKPADAPTGSGDSGADAAPAAATSTDGKTSMASPARQGIDVNIYVHDGRISVTRTAANARQHGAPGQLGSRGRYG